MSPKTPAPDAAAFAVALGNEIRAARGRKHLTQEEVFTACDLSKSAFIKLENGKAGVSRSMEQVRRIAAALDMPASELVRLAELAMEDERA